MQTSDGRHVVLVNLEFPPSSGPGIWRAFAFTKYLARAGYRVTVICSERSTWQERGRDENLLNELPETVRVISIPSLFFGEILEKIDARIARARFALTRAFWQGLRWRVNAYYPDNVMHWAAKAVVRGIGVMLRNRPACVITTGPPHLSHLVGLVLNALSRAPWVVDIRDLWIEDETMHRQTAYQPRMVRYLERLFMARASAVVAIAPTMRQVLVDKYSASADSAKFHLILNGHDLDRSVLESAGAAPAGRKRLHMHFNGTIQRGHAIEVLIDVLHRLKAESPDPESLPLVTFTGIQAKVAEQMRSAGIEDVVRDVGSMPHRESLEYARSCDVLFEVLRNDLVRKGAIPGKMYEAMALGKHVLAIVPAGADLAAVLEEYGNATICDVDDRGSICDAIRAMQRQFVERKGSMPVTDPERRRLVFEKYARENQTSQLIELIGSLTK